MVGWCGGSGGWKGACHSAYQKPQPGRLVWAPRGTTSRVLRSPLRVRVDVEVVDLPAAARRGDAELDRRLAAGKQREQIRGDRHLHGRLPAGVSADRPDRKRLCLAGAVDVEDLDLQ